MALKFLNDCSRFSRALSSSSVSQSYSQWCWLACFLGCEVVKSFEVPFKFTWSINVSLSWEASLLAILLISCCSKFWLALPIMQYQYHGVIARIILTCVYFWFPKAVVISPRTWRCWLVLEAVLVGEIVYSIQIMYRQVFRGKWLIKVSIHPQGWRWRVQGTCVGVLKMGDG